MHSFVCTFYHNSQLKYKKGCKRFCVTHIDRRIDAKQTRGAKAPRLFLAQLSDADSNNYRRKIQYKNSSKYANRRKRGICAAIPAIYGSVENKNFDKISATTANKR